MVSGRQDSLRVAVIGLGTMGSHHLRVYSSMKGVEVVAVVDVDRDTAESAARRYQCQAFGSVESLVGKIDAASIAVPSIDHAVVGKYLLENGIHCLIEKPLATNPRDCQDLIAASQARGVVLLVGHIERFNPAVETLFEMLNGGGTVHAIDVRRMSPISQRIRDVDVVADLMVHDLDIVRALMQSPVAQVEAQGVRTSGLNGQDYVTALIGFRHGGLASLTASRITQNKVREVQVTSDIGTILADYSTQEVLVFRHGSVAERAGKLAEPLGYVVDLSVERVLVRPGEPLIAELRHFVDAITNGTPVRVTGEQALETLHLVWQVQQDVSEIENYEPTGR